MIKLEEGIMAALSEKQVTTWTLIFEVWQSCGIGLLACGT
jgi:hypothetical protein